MIRTTKAIRDPSGVYHKRGVKQKNQKARFNGTVLKCLIFAITVPFIIVYLSYASFLITTATDPLQEHKPVIMVNIKNDKNKHRAVEKKEELQTAATTIKPVLRAYIETTDQSEWEIKPLPTRTTKSTDLNVKEFPKVSSCTKLLENWPIDEEVAPTNSDPFLPWIHDVFPTADGKFIQFVAQNKRRCQTGKEQQRVLDFMQPNVALFQHVPLKRVLKDGQQRYRLSTHEEADPDGIETRFICRFKPSMEETLSVFNFNYDWNSVRKAYKSTFTEEGFDVHIVWNSQHLFRCPVPESLWDTVRDGSSVVDDYATRFVDLVPIRTPPRYILPETFLPPRYGYEDTWNATQHYGSHHVLPRIQDSGRWENIPICKPSLMTYPDEPRATTEQHGGSPTDDDKQHDHNMADTALITKQNEQHDQQMAQMALTKQKKNRLIACTWTSAGFHTRGDSNFISDGSQRLMQWVTFNKLVGVDHVYIYDNSAATSTTENLTPITDLFPGFVTRINWPSKVCNNNSRMAPSKGERSSQYAAESSCRLRFGAHSDWLASFDTDEYPVPMPPYDNLKNLLDDMDKEDIRILNFASMRSKPRLQMLNYKKKSSKTCSECFNPSLPANKTFLEVYNCNRERPPRKALMAAEKQIYRTDYVLLHFVHYSAITAISVMSEKEVKSANLSKYTYKRRYTDAHTRYTNEATEATMLHTKAIAEKETRNWRELSYSGKQRIGQQRIGIEYPLNADYNEFDENAEAFYVQMAGEKKSLVANCFPIEKIDTYWVPKLNAALAEVDNQRFDRHDESMKTHIN